MATQNLVGVTNLVPKILASTRPSGTSATTVYTVPANTGAVIKHAVLNNTTGSAVTVSVSVVASGGTAGATNQIVTSYSLAANDALSLAGLLAGACLGPGDFISVTTATANSVTVTITGTENS